MNRPWLLLACAACGLGIGSSAVYVTSGVDVESVFHLNVAALVVLSFIWGWVVREMGE